MKRRHLEFEIVFFSYIVAGVLSGVISVFILKGMGVLVPGFFKGGLLLNAFVPLAIAAFMATYIILTKFDYHFRKLSLAEDIRRSLNETVLLAACWAMILIATKTGVTDSRYYFFCTLLVNFALIFAEWVFIARYLVPRYRNTDGASLVGIITNRKRVHYVTEWMQKDWARRVTGICLVDMTFDEAPEEIDSIPVTCDLSSLIETVQLHPMDEVFFELDADERPQVMHAVHEMIRMGIRVHMNVPEAQRLDAEMADVVKDDYAPEISREFKYGLKEPVIIMGPPRKRMRAYIAKRTLDIIGGIVGLAICGILYVILGIAIKLDSPGPVIFAQERIGMNGRRFKMYKFRSMYQDAEERKKELLDKNEMNGLMFKMEDDPRITKVGKFIRRTSLDEFPQFLNVLKGDMSLVGTRPPTVNEFRQYSSYHKRRLSMRPGITGLWQTSGRSDISDFEEVVRLDCEYIDTWTIGGDLKILLSTVGQIFKPEGAK